MQCCAVLWWKHASKGNGMVSWDLHLPWGIEKNNLQCDFPEGREKNPGRWQEEEQNKNQMDIVPECL